MQIQHIYCGHGLRVEIGMCAHVGESQTTRQDLDLKAGTSGQGETYGKKACQLVVQPNRELTLVKRAGFPRPCQADYKAFWPRQFGPGAHVMASQKH